MHSLQDALGEGALAPENGDVLAAGTVQDVWDQESSNGTDSEGAGGSTQGQGNRPCLADAVMSTIRGGQDAQRLAFALKDGMAPADALLEGLQAIQAAGDPDRLRGFARALQKIIERRVA